MKIAIVLALLLAPAIADARHICASKTIGLSRCARFGAWTHSFSVDLEGAFAMQTLALDHIDTMVGTGRVVGDPGTVHARGGVMRVQYDLVRHIVYGTEMILGSFDDAHPLTTTAALGGPAMPQTALSGLAFTASMYVGVHTIAGSISYGGELAPGISVVTLDPTAAMIARVDVRARAELWMSPHWTLGATAGVNALDPRDVMLALGIGVHLMPWDGMR